MIWSDFFSRSVTPRKPKLAAATLSDAYEDFAKSRQAMRCSPATLAFYFYTAAAFVNWTKARGAKAPAEITPRAVREYLAQLAVNGKADTTLHDHARAIKTLLRFWHAEGYIPAPVLFAMPRLQQKRMLMLTADELGRLVAACNGPRDKALIWFLADSGLRRAEICALNCCDVDMASGRIRVNRGKGGKARSAAIGDVARRALLEYRQDFQSPDQANTALFLSRSRTRLTGGGVLLIFRRLWKTTGIHVTPHALRRTFATLALRSGIGVLQLQALLGHASLEMTERYVQLIDDDLLQAHRLHSPIDHLDLLKRELPAPEASRALPA